MAEFPDHFKIRAKLVYVRQSGLVNSCRTFMLISENNMEYIGFFKEGNRDHLRLFKDIWRIVPESEVDPEELDGETEVCLDHLFCYRA